MQNDREATKTDGSHILCGRRKYGVCEGSRLHLSKNIQASLICFAFDLHYLCKCFRLIPFCDDKVS